MTVKKLSNELIERFIRVEQRVSSHFGQPVKYNQTEYFKSLTNEEKKSFERYMKKNKKGHSITLPLICLALLILLLLNLALTGRVVQETFSINLSFLNYFFVLVLLFIVIYLALNFSSKKSEKKRFDYHLKPLEQILARYRFKK